jgi:hypothetical protein
MFSSGIFPARLKYAVSKPTFKNGDRSDVSNCRPISLLPAFSKVFEKVLYVRMYQHLINNNILVDEQFGFRTKSSITTATFNLISEIIDAFNSKQIVGGIFCDLKKAFDSVDHDILLSKLEFYGIRGKFKELIKSYLTNRYQRVSITSKNSCRSSFSKWGEVRCGVPQGSILGPLFFLLYINDLTRVFGKNHKPVLFPDDTSLIVTHFNYIDFSNEITSAFNQLNKWFAANSLSLNLKKNSIL